MQKTCINFSFVPYTEKDKTRHLSPKGKGSVSHKPKTGNVHLNKENLERSILQPTLYHEGSINRNFSFNIHSRGVILGSVVKFTSEITETIRQSTHLLHYTPLV